jgi:Fe-S-cluster-containing dehydrogenase component
MSLRRRDFVTRGALAAGAAAVTASGAHALGLLGRPGAAPSGEMVPALTADGRLVEVSAEADRPPGAHENGGDPSLREGIPGRRWAMVIDLALCDGCDDCTVVCREHHMIEPDREWIRIYRMQDSPDTSPYWFPKPCFHCDNPPCTKVCPVGATYKRSDGLVLVDSDRCIGCRFCMAACPYSVRVFNWSKSQPPADAEHGAPGALARRVGTVEKCDFCADTLPATLPHCVTVCTMGAVYFGDANEDAVTNGRGETVRLSQLLHDRAAYRFREDLGTQPRVYYLPPSGRRYPAPELHHVHAAAGAGADAGAS